MKEKITPLKIKIGFKKLFDHYRDKVNSTNLLIAERAKSILAIESEYPQLTDGIEDLEDLNRLKEPINFVLEDLFSEVLSSNEIKIATAPFQERVLRASKRYQEIRKLAGKDFTMELRDFSDDEYFIMGCSIILSTYYGYSVDFRRPFYYRIPDKNGILRSYRVLYNGDFVSVEKGSGAKDITSEDVAELLDHFDDVSLWKEKFPPGSWIFNGFVLANMYDATIDVSLSNFKEGLLEIESNDERFVKRFQEIIRSIFNLPKVNIGYAIYDHEEKSFCNPPKIHGVSSYILNEENSKECKLSLCEHSYDTLYNRKEIFSISNVQKQLAKYPDNVLLKTLSDQGISSAIIAPLVSGKDLLGILEIVSETAGELNSINATKLKDLMPYLVDSMRRSKERRENEMELLIQEECTSIHPSVLWRFRKEASRVLREQQDGNAASFKEIVFENVYPLYGQTDIKGSSEARNEATKRDLELQLKLVKDIILEIHSSEQLPIYEQLVFRIDHFLGEIENHMEVDSERRVLNFLKKEILPLYKHVAKRSEHSRLLIEDYHKLLDKDKGFIYQNRKDYDNSVALINKTLAHELDKKQREAQEMYPHFYERFKTDGVEHNIYIGESITKEVSFNKIYLYNLRLWQLQVMCEMENKYFQLKSNLPVPLEVASMILVFNSSLALRFRMDEKRFDVDGTYNARYEVVKKRVDKAKIKGTEERITQPGKIAIVYSQREDEAEFLKYVQFLQSKNQLGDEIEILELEDLQGVTGLKALRVNVLYHKGAKDEHLYTYEDLINTLNDN